MTTENTLNIINSGLPIFNSTTGQFAAVAATSLGDMIIHNGTIYTVLSAGTNDKVLTADSAQASNFVWDDLPFTGDWTLLDTQTASSSATVDFTDLDTSTYESFHIRAVNVHPATDSVNLQCFFSIDNGVSYISSGYEYVYRRFDTGSGSDTAGNSSSASFIQSAEDIGNAPGEGVAGWFWFLPSGTPTQMRHAIEWQLYSQDAGNDLNGFWGGAINSTTSAVDALRFKFSSGNIEVGSFYLYGLSTS